MKRTHRILILFLLSVSAKLIGQGAVGSVEPGTPIFEKTFQSSKTYSEPFNDVDVDVVFTQGESSWRVPAFWRGGNEWTVRFAPPLPGEFTYSLESTDHANPDLNGHLATMTVAPYQGTSAAWQHGAPRVAASKRYFETADGKPFFWLGDTWWDGLSSRLSWDGFQRLTADRKAKGFTVVQLVAGLIPGEEVAPIDPGAANEGGQVWDADYKTINPKYFDYADRRIEHLVDSNMVPAIVGGWGEVLNDTGVEKMKKHWRYIIARYGAYPVFWIVGGEVFDPPDDVGKQLTNPFGKSIPGGWSEVARYIRATDPYHHPITVHQVAIPYDTPLREDSLTDFDMFQPAHYGWPSIGLSVTELDMRHALRNRTKPEVIGEIGYEGLGEDNPPDFQRAAFWLDMLNGAAGHTYGANGVFETDGTEKQLQRTTWSFVNWEEGMKLPGSYEVGLGAKLMEKYPWWQFEPHPDWITPHGTIVLEPRDSITLADWGDVHWDNAAADSFSQPLKEEKVPDGVWRSHGGNFRLPYAAGIPGQVRFIYMPCFNMFCEVPPTILGLEPQVRYHAFYWQPSLGIKVDLGTVENDSPGAVLRREKPDSDPTSWTIHRIHGSEHAADSSAAKQTLAILNGTAETDVVASVNAQSSANAMLILRFHDVDNYLAATYSARDKAIYLIERTKGVDGSCLYSTPVGVLGSSFRLTAEVRGRWITVAASDGQHAYSSGITQIENLTAGAVGYGIDDSGNKQKLSDFVLRQVPASVKDEHLERKLYDAEGKYRGEMAGPPTPPELGGDPDGGWDGYAREKVLLLDEYRPPRLPTPGDWLLVLEHTNLEHAN